MRLTLLSNFVGLALVAFASLAFASPTGTARDVPAANAGDDLFARANQNNGLANGKRCWANKQCKSGKNPGGQSFERTSEELNKWFGTYNGNVQIKDTEIHTLSLGPSCNVGDSVTVDLRNVTRVLEYAGGSD